MSAARFNPLRSDARQALNRLRTFHAVVAEHSARHFPTLVMNDGAVAYRDLSLKSRSATHDFLTRAWNLFSAIRKEESKGGYPGARLVLACGFRMRGRRAGLDQSRRQFALIANRLQNCEIDAQQAVKEFSAMRPRFDIVPQLQANFAFTKAYIAEQGGSEAGLPGSQFYVETLLFGGRRPAWINLGPDISWAHPSLDLKATFAAVEGFTTRRHLAGGPPDVLDGLAIAQVLAQDKDVLSALRAAAKS